MTDRTERIENAINRYRLAFRLTDWDIRYTPDNTRIDKDSAAETHIRHYQRAATVRVDDKVPDSQVERCVVHEMVHLVLSDMTDVYNHALSKQGAAGLGTMDLLADMIERICEQVAEAVTGIPWEPIGKKNRDKHLPFIHHSVSEEVHDA